MVHIPATLSKYRRKVDTAEGVVESYGDHRQVTEWAIAIGWDADKSLDRS